MESSGFVPSEYGAGGFVPRLGRFPAMPAPPWVSDRLRWRLHGVWSIAAAGAEAGLGLWLRRIEGAERIGTWLAVLAALLAARVALSLVRDMLRERLAIEAGRAFHRRIWSGGTSSRRDPAWLVREGRDSIEAGTRAALEIRTATASIALSLPLIVWIAPWISLGALVSMGLVARLARGKATGLARLASQEAQASETLSLEEEWSWRSVPEVRPSGLFPVVARLRRRSYAGYSEGRFGRIRSQLMLGAGGEALAHAAGWALGAAALVGWKSGSLSGGSLLAFLGLCLLAYRPVREAGRHLPNLRRAEEAWNSTSRERAGRTIRTETSTRAQGVGLRRPGLRRPVLEGITFEIEPGQVVLVHGPNGCGKSTLLRILAGAEPDHDGLVRVPRRVFWMAQEPVLPPAPPGILFGPSGARPDILEILFPDGLPAGLDPSAPIPRGGRNLSQGERARVCLLAACSRPSELWILDEPLAAIPADQAASILRLVLAARGNRSVILAQPGIPDGFRSTRSILAGSGPVRGPFADLLEEA